MVYDFILREARPSLTLNIIVFAEYLLYRKHYDKIPLWRYKVPIWFYNAYSVLVSFVFGLLITILISTCLKGSIGRLRPSFMSACVPNINCSLPENRHVYHMDYQCTNKDFDINNRLSFPSGHSSFAMFCGLFLVVYFQKRVPWNMTLLKSGVQLVSIALVLYVGATRITDFKHHWTDVFGAYVIGALCAASICVNLYGNFSGLSLPQQKPTNSGNPQTEVILQQ